VCAHVLDEFHRSLSVHGRELRISVSVGASIYPDHAGDAHALLRAADTALFRAKELGRNGWSLFVPQLLEAAASRFKGEQAVARAGGPGGLSARVCISGKSASRRSRRTRSRRCCAGASRTATSLRRRNSSTSR